LKTKEKLCRNRFRENSTRNFLEMNDADVAYDLADTAARDNGIE